MDKRFDVVAMGELLIDMTNNGKSEQGNAMYEANPGGAPCNVLAMLKKLGHEVAFIGKVGDDIFGAELRGVLQDIGIDTKGLVTDKEVRTTLAFVKTFEDGDRDFSFYRNPGADMMLKKEEIDDDLLKNTGIFHFGTLSMTHEGVREATLHAVKTAKDAGALISFDPNLREPLWKSLDEAKEQVLSGMSYCDILKISDNEIQWLTGEEDYTEGVKKIYEKFDIPLITVSLGKEGSRAYYKKEDEKDGFLMVEVPPFLQKNTIETTGAGDTFGGCVLHYILEKGLKGLTASDLEEMIRFANGAASIITTRRGALRVMPEKEEVEELVRHK
ncbi:MAG: carbohydrate kinase [Lachnospiraceae bacterium]|nr:carbohydrate kinase [Lachnospiraceae bacterium]